MKSTLLLTLAAALSLSLTAYPAKSMAEQVEYKSYSSDSLIVYLEIMKKKMGAIPSELKTKINAYLTKIQQPQPPKKDKTVLTDIDHTLTLEKIEPSKVGMYRTLNENRQPMEMLIETEVLRTANKSSSFYEFMKNNLAEKLKNTSDLTERAKLQAAYNDLRKMKPAMDEFDASLERPNKNTNSNLESKKQATAQAIK